MALFAHFDEALWLTKALLQTLTTSFVLNAPRLFRKNDVVSVCNEAFANQRATARWANKAVVVPVTAFKGYEPRTSNACSKKYTQNHHAKGTLSIKNTKLQFFSKIIGNVYLCQEKAQNSCPLKAVTGTTAALFAHLDKALWLAKALTTSFVLNAPRIRRKNGVIRVCNVGLLTKEPR